MLPASAPFVSAGVSPHCVRRHRKEAMQRDWAIECIAAIAFLFVLDVYDFLVIRHKRGGYS
jgi:hypothetical protein